MGAKILRSSTRCKPIILNSWAGRARRREFIKVVGAKPQDPES